MRVFVCVSVFLSALLNLCVWQVCVEKIMTTSWRHMFRHCGRWLKVIKSRVIIFLPLKSGLHPFIHLSRCLCVYTFVRLSFGHWHLCVCVCFYLDWSSHQPVSLDVVVLPLYIYRYICVYLSATIWRNLFNKTVVRSFLVLPFQYPILLPSHLSSNTLCAMHGPGIIIPCCYGWELRMGVFGWRMQCVRVCVCVCSIIVVAIINIKW